MEKDVLHFLNVFFSLTLSVLLYILFFQHSPNGFYSFLFALQKRLFYRWFYIIPHRILKYSNTWELSLLSMDNLLNSQKNRKSRSEWTKRVERTVAQRTNEVNKLYRRNFPRFSTNSHDFNIRHSAHDYIKHLIYTRKNLLDGMKDFHQVKNLMQNFNF